MRQQASRGNKAPASLQLQENKLNKPEDMDAEKLDFDTAAMTPEKILQLQKTIGNQAVLQLLKTQQTAQRSKASQSPIQRVPSGTYANTTPSTDGTHWDTDETVDDGGETVPSEVISVMRNPGNGGTPSVDPPGWDWLKTKFGRLKGDWVRFHIINARLGGPGNDTTNLIPTTHTLNHNGNWRNLEEEAKDSASNQEDWTYVEVDITYDSEFPAGIPESIDAEWGSWDANDDDWVRARSVSLSQVNPDDDDGDNNYLPASLIPNSRLQAFGLNVRQAQAARILIDETWEDQDDFDRAWAGEDGNFEIDDDLINSIWFTVNGRMYVDEDDDFAGPYRVVVRNT